MGKLVFTCMLLFCSGWVQAASVWQVSHGNNTLYLGGTLHLLSPSDYPLPTIYHQVYQQSDVVVFETDIAALSSTEFAHQSMQVLSYSDEETLKDNISETTLAALEAHLEQRGLTTQRFMKFRPALIGVTLSMIEFQRMGLTSQGVDKYFYTRALNDGKTLDWFETPQEQLNFIANMGQEDEDAYILYTLEDISTMPDLIDKLKQDWRKGNMKSLYDHNMQEFIQEYPKVYDELLTQRNVNWLPKLKTMLNTPQTELVLVGTLHMPGDTGLLRLLEKEGFTVKQLNSEIAD